MAGAAGGVPAVRSPDSTFARMLPLLGDAGGGDARATAAVKQSGVRSTVAASMGRMTDTLQDSCCANSAAHTLTCMMG